MAGGAAGRPGPAGVNERENETAGGLVRDGLCPLPTPPARWEEGRKEVGHQHTSHVCAHARERACVRVRAMQIFEGGEGEKEGRVRKTDSPGEREREQRRNVSFLILPLRRGAGEATRHRIKPCVRRACGRAGVFLFKTNKQKKTTTTTKRGVCSRTVYSRPTPASAAPPLPSRAAASAARAFWYPGGGGGIGPSGPSVPSNPRRSMRV